MPVAGARSSSLSPEGDSHPTPGPQLCSSGRSVQPKLLMGLRGCRAHPGDSRRRNGAQCWGQRPACWVKGAAQGGKSVPLRPFVQYGRPGTVRGWEGLQRHGVKIVLELKDPPPRHSCQGALGSGPRLPRAMRRVRVPVSLNPSSGPLPPSSDSKFIG